MKNIVPFLTFQDQATDAMEYYNKTFVDSDIVSIVYYPDKPNLVLNGLMKIKNRDLYFLDLGRENEVKVGWNITLFFETDSKTEFYTIFDRLKDKGNVMMGPEKFESSDEIARFELVTWITDKFNITWQIVLR